MASARASCRLLVLLAVVTALLASCNSAAAQPSSSCLSEMVSLSSCLGYMSGNSSAPKPSCCTSLSSVVSSNPRCLCMVLGGGASSLGVTINNTRALELPGACNVKTPPASECKSAGVPSPATPATTSTTSPASSQTPAVPNVTPAAGAGSKAMPTTGQYSSGGRSIGQSTSIPVMVIVSAALVLLTFLRV